MKRTWKWIPNCCVAVNSHNVIRRWWFNARPIPKQHLFIIISDSGWVLGFLCEENLEVVGCNANIRVRDNSPYQPYNVVVYVPDFCTSGSAFPLVDINQCSCSGPLFLFVSVSSPSPGREWQ